MTSFEFASPSVDGVAADRRLAEIDQVLFGLRSLRAEVELVAPGLVLDRVEGWHSGAADHYADRAAEMRYALAGAGQLLLDAEEELVAERDRVRAARPIALAPDASTPHRPVSTETPR